MQNLAQLNVDARELDGWRLGGVEGVCRVAERRQHLRGVVDEVAQLAGVHRVAAGTQSEVIELYIATAPSEFDRLELGGKCDVGIDRHGAILRFRRLRAGRPGSRTSWRGRWCRLGRGRY